MRHGMSFFPSVPVATTTNASSPRACSSFPSPWIMLAFLGLFATWEPSGLWAEESSVLEKTIRLRGLPDDEIPVVTSLSIHPTEDLLATAGDDHLVRLWDLQSGQIIRTLHGHTDWVTRVAFCRNGQQLLTAGRDRRLLNWDLRSGGPPVSVGTHRRPISGIALHPQSQRLAVTGFRSTLKLFDLPRSGRARLTQEATCPCLDTRALGFSPNGQWLAAAGRNGKIRIWNLRSGQSFDLAGHKRRVTNVVFASDSLLLSAGEEQVIHMWNVPEQMRQHSLKHRAGKVLAMTMLDATRFAVSTAQNVIVLCDVRDSSPYAILQGHTGSVAAIVARGDHLVSGSFDTTVRIWNISRAGTGSDNQAHRPRPAVTLE